MIALRQSAEPHLSKWRSTSTSRVFRTSKLTTNSVVVGCWFLLDTSIFCSGAGGAVQGAGQRRTNGMQPRSAGRTPGCMPSLTQAAQEGWRQTCRCLERMRYQPWPTPRAVAAACSQTPSCRATCRQVWPFPCGQRHSTPKYAMARLQPSWDPAVCSLSIQQQGEWSPALAQLSCLHSSHNTALLCSPVQVADGPVGVRLALHVHKGKACSTKASQ